MRPSEAPLFQAEAIARRVAELAGEINRDFKDRDTLLLPVLKGGIHFASDLMRQLDIPLRVDFIRARSYRGTESGGSVEFLVLPTETIEGRHVLLLEDIVDTGRTTHALLERLRAGAPASLSLCTLLDKPARRICEVHPHYVGFEIEDRFVVGYGMDYEERYRELPAIYVLEEDAPR